MPLDLWRGPKGQKFSNSLVCLCLDLRLFGVKIGSWRVKVIMLPDLVLAGFIVVTDQEVGGRQLVPLITLTFYRPWH